MIVEMDLLGLCESPCARQEITLSVPMAFVVLPTVWVHSGSSGIELAARAEIRLPVFRRQTKEY